MGFTQEEYTFYDDDGKARVCVGFRSGCKHDVSLLLELTTTGGNAGNVQFLHSRTNTMPNSYIADDGVYSGITESLTLDSCEDECVNIIIHNNNNNALKKNKESYFYVNVNLTNDPGRVKLFPDKSKVTIKDSTSKRRIMCKKTVMNY